MAEPSALVVGWAEGRDPRLAPAWVRPAERPVEGGPVAVAPGIAFLLGRDLRGPASAADVLGATTVVLGALVLGAPDRDHVLVLGPVARDHRTLDLSLLGVVLEVDGVQRGTSCGAAALGHPASAIARSLGEETIQAGSVVSAGPLLPACELLAGSHATAGFGHLGAVTVRVV